MLAQELALRNYRLKYNRNPRKSGPIPIAGKQDNHLKEYQAEQLPRVRKNLTLMLKEIDEIKKAFTSTRHPNWYKQTLTVEDLTGQIWKKMNAIEINLILTENYPIKESNESIIEQTKQALEIAWDIKRELLFFRLDRISFSLDEFGIFEIIVDESPKEEPPTPEQPYMDLSLLWHQSRRSRG